MKIGCKCGQIVGQIDKASSKTITRAKCYCKDCQAAAKLAPQFHILDENGGTEVFQANPVLVSFQKGTDKIACTRLSPNGLLRWSSSCCNTPLANTLPNPKFAFVSFVHTAVKSEESSGDNYDPTTARTFHVNTAAAQNGPIKEVGRRRMIFKILSNVMRARVTGSYKRNPFFNIKTGKPIVEPRILSGDEKAALYS